MKWKWPWFILLNQKLMTKVKNIRSIQEDMLWLPFLHSQLYFISYFKICSSMMFSTCNPIASVLAAIYEIPTFLVSLAANGFLLMHPLLTFVCNLINLKIRNIYCQLN